MYFEQFYLGCLAHASYMLASEGEAIVIDPQRDVEIYLTAAAEHDLKIRHIFESHLHADFVSGHKELAERTGATIYIVPTAERASPAPRLATLPVAGWKDAHRRPEYTRPHARKHLHGRHRRGEVRQAMGSLHRRHSFHWRCGPPGLSPSHTHPPSLPDFSTKASITS